ncbi:hypothetical protein KAT73_05400, partial [candidate division WOR-3 bacterium]|nr:hypothetical protein [candidate division WOR-3 bacterium]
GGGNHYFSLDITNTHYPSYMWDFTDIDLGETWSKPMICKVKIPGDRWVAVFGGGYHSNNEKGKAVYMLNTGNGNNIFKYDDTYSSDIKYSFPSSARSLDMSPMDGYTDRIYIGDLGGQMWRFDVSDSSTSSWTGTVIFTAPTATPGNPIFYPPSLSYDLEDNLWVFFGTGDRENPRDVSGQNRFYGIKDKGITLREANIKDITSGGSPPYTNGWFIKLGTGEKVLAGTVVVEGIVYFTTYQAINTGDPCAISGVAKLYRVNFTQGSYVVDVIGTSLPTTPQVSISSEGVLTIIISLAEGTIFTEISEAGPALKQLLYWKEIRP